MPKILLTIALIFGINSVLFSQSGWIWQNPLPQGNTMSNLQFVNSTTSFAMCFNSVMKSTNVGSNWSIYYTNHNQNNASMHFINETTGFIVSDTGIVLKTVNGGVDWNIISNFNQMKFHKIYFNDVNIGYAIRYNNIYGNKGTTFYRTSNGGMNWNILINDTTFVLSDIEFSNSQTGYVGGSVFLYSYAKIYRSTNFGVSWDSLNTNFSCGIVGLEYSNNNLYAFGYKSYPSSKGMFLSTNQGTNWIPTEITKDVRDFSYVDPNNVYATATSSGVFLYKSTNNGFNWFNLNSDIKSYDIEFLAPNSGVSVGGNGQIHKTTNSGVNWIGTTTAFFNNYFWSVEFVNNTTGFAGGGNTLFKTINGGNNWFLIPRIPGEQIEFTNVNTGYVVNYDTLYKTTNCGLNWINLNYGLYGQLNAVHFLNSNTGYILGKYNVLKKTTDGGNSWTQITGYGGNYQECMYFYNESLGFIGRNDYNLGWGISRTTNGGLNWDFQSVPIYDYYIWDIFFINENTGFYTTSNRIFKTTNSGNSWYIVCEGLTFYDIMSIQFLDENIGYASASGGKVLKTADGGSTWKIHNSISNYLFYDMYFTDINTGYFVSFDGVIIKTTNGCGDPIGIEPISSNIPESFELYQNYPNPFNPVTTIRFSIPVSANGRNGFTTLKIYDILGREIAVPVSEILIPGEYVITWDGSSYPSGVYFYSLSSGEYNITRKLIFVK